MSKESDKITADINRYIDAMKGTGKMPSVVYITRKQFQDLQIGLGKGMEKNWKPRIRTIPIEVIKHGSDPALQEGVSDE